MDRPELALLKKIKLRTSKKLNTLFVGEYHSAFKGHGLSFDSVREYQFGDDVKSIDWNVSARMDHLYIKEYVEERDLSVVFIIDVSGSTEFGTKKSKKDIIMEVSALFLQLSQLNNDSVSVLLFSDTVEMYIKPKKGRKFILKVLDEILKCKPDSRHTNISGALDFIRKVLKKRSIIFLISDFIDADSDYLLKLKHLKRKHDIIPIQVYDPLEKEMKLFGLTEFVDLETGNVFLSDTVPEKSKFPVLTEFDSISLNTVDPIERPILQFFEKRNRTTLLR